jgi:hypothetical protein
MKRADVPIANCLNGGAQTTKNCECANLVCLNRRVHPTEVCRRKCAIRFGPVCAKVNLFNTTIKRFRAGLAVGKLLISIDESRKEAFRDPPTLNQ